MTVTQLSTSNDSMSLFLMAEMKAFRLALFLSSLEILGPLWTHISYRVFQSPYLTVRNVGILKLKFYSHCAFLHPGVLMGTGDVNAWLPCDGLTSHPGGSRNTPSRFMLQKPGQTPA